MERAFVAELSDGDMDDAFSVARQLVKLDENNGLAQLVLGVKAMGDKRYAAARVHFAKGGAKTDVTANLLIAWTYAGVGDTKRAIDTLSRFNQPRFKIFREYHEGLIDEFAGSAADARTHLKAAYDSDPETLRIVDAWARFSDRAGDATEAKRAYQAFDQLLPRHPLVKSALSDLAAGKKLDPLIRSAQGGAAEVFYGLGAAGGQDSDELPAMIYLRMALYLAPHNDLATVTLADLYERLKQHETAIEVYQTLARTSPLQINGEVQIGLIDDELGQHDEALKTLSAVVAQHPDDVDAITALGNLQRSQKNYTAAAASYTTALDKSGGPSVKSNWTLLYFRGISNERLNHWPAAEADFKQALTLFPDQPLVLNYLGYSWIERGMNFDAAFKMVQKAAELRPDDGYIVDSLGWAYYKTEKYDDAERVLERAVQLQPADPVVNEHLGDAYWQVGRKLEAHFQWNHARDLGPDKEDLPRILQKIAHGLDQPSRPAAAGNQPSTQQPAKTGG